VSVATAPVLAIAPAPTAPPVISGTAEDGQTVTATQGTWTGDPATAYTYQWQACESSGTCSDVGDDAASYELQSTDVGSTVQVLVTAANSGGSASQTSTPTAVVAPAPPTDAAAPTISGTAGDGATLTVDPGSWSGTPTISYSYQWQNCDPSGADCWSIAGATGSRVCRRRVAGR
jgi:hypothetical protein